MKECVQQYYLLGGEIHECDTFDKKYLDEGKTIYEVARLSGTKLLFLEDHTDRLFNSLKLEGLSSPISRQEITRQLDQLIRLNNAKAGNVKYLINFSNGHTGIFLAYFTEHKYPAASEYRDGVKVITYPFERIEPNKKVWRPSFRSNVADAIRINRVSEAFLLDKYNRIPEASRSNIFAIKNGRIITPPEDRILAGITRKYALEACRELEIPVELRMIELGELKDFEAIFMTSTSLQVIPVRKVDSLDIPVGDSLTQKIMKQFNAAIENHLK